ncbi:pyrroline-5-carboxylate reductase [Salinarimonas soli]|uniref:Pyrroline-5-carboxylate reductase n=1 Tax=Salinarimonas soli TaxID=1638099 RepID=A0A5B2W161_9HYPH|nr:pyrroline-5-carboxylate reductase [Salinarimonas soli]KAA2244187.1 pyrroline-5-carboxylate reductase [Salinarimonas soli]
MNAALPPSLALVGAGKMGGAMLEGWLSIGLPPHAVSVFDAHPSDAIQALCAARGLALNPQQIAPPAVLVLATKPQTLEAVAPLVEGIVSPDTVLVSILAGKTIADLLRRVPTVRAVVRAMPNLPASIGAGATGAFANEAVTEEGRARAHALLAANGIVEWLPSEDLIDAVTALSGSGPSYVFHLVECLAEAGAQAGLPPDLALRLARATVTGAGRLLEASDLGADVLRQNVTSPGGTTAAALEVLMGEGGMAPLMTEAVAAAKRRAEALSG